MSRMLPGIGYATLRIDSACVRQLGTEAGIELWLQPYGLAKSAGR